MLNLLEPDEWEELINTTDVQAFDEVLYPSLEVMAGATIATFSPQQSECICVSPLPLDQFMRAKAIKEIFFARTDSEYATRALDSTSLMNIILDALENKQPLSVVSAGATESFVMAQYVILPEEVFMNHPEAWIANQGEKSGFMHRGIRFPNREARDAAVEALGNADIVGYNTIVRTNDAGLLTERVFSAYDIHPKHIFEANLRRVLMFSQQEKFHHMLANRKIVLISSIAEETKEQMSKRMQHELNFEIVGTIPIYEYEEIPIVKELLKQYEFDLCLLAAGTNALILAPYIAQSHHAVAVDIGSGMTSLITGAMVSDEWIEKIIGIETLMNL